MSHILRTQQKYQTMSIESCDRINAECNPNIVPNEDIKKNKLNEFCRCKHGKYLAVSCKTISKDDPDCFIPVTGKDPTPAPPAALAVDPLSEKFLVKADSLKTTVWKVQESCDPKNNLCPQYSNCKKVADTSLYECNCATNFNEVGKVPLEIYGSTDDPKYFISSCQVDDLCQKYKCTFDGKGRCLQNTTFSEKDGWLSTAGCECGHGRSFDSKANLCADNCASYDCHNNGKSKMLESGQCGCDCEEKYYGENCKDEYSAAMGGWIAGIVILAVAVVIASIAAGVFWRRSRSPNVHSGHELGDFNNTSAYRVPSQGQGRGQRNEGFNSGV
ncbi:unnamed protein product [Oppiella nova]|uniref:EGF-like domain-containing protein n=1 Tax=Oppiella nova TaxID=334625 RepID=A0A7R9QIR8_9ACAR|nr:unnamed protein product [Oppiella nova]CAG2166760.1 unnamed protein product [Oppiella nova]